MHGNGTVVIGNNCDIAPDVTFLTGGHQIGNAERRAGAGETYQITVGSGVWIGARATILLNTVIGGGVPARVIKELEDGPAEHFQE